MNQMQKMADQYDIAIAVLEFLRLTDVEMSSGEADLGAVVASHAEILGLIDRVINDHNGEFSLGSGTGTKDVQTGKGKQIQVNITVRAFSQDGTQ